MLQYPPHHKSLKLGDDPWPNLERSKYRIGTFKQTLNNFIPIDLKSLVQSTGESSGVGRDSKHRPAFHCAGVFQDIGAIRCLSSILIISKISGRLPGWFAISFDQTCPNKKKTDHLLGEFEVRRRKLHGNGICGPFTYCAKPQILKPRDLFKSNFRGMSSHTFKSQEKALLWSTCINNGHWQLLFWSMFSSPKWWYHCYHDGSTELCQTTTVSPHDSWFCKWLTSPTHPS